MSIYKNINNDIEVLPIECKYRENTIYYVEDRDGIKHMCTVIKTDELRECDKQCMFSKYNLSSRLKFVGTPYVGLFGSSNIKINAQNVLTVTSCNMICNGSCGNICFKEL